MNQFGALHVCIRNIIIIYNNKIIILYETRLKAFTNVDMQYKYRLFTEVKVSMGFIASRGL